MSGRGLFTSTSKPACLKVDSHISRLIALRHVLHHRLRQLHHLLSPINTLPIEVLSYIFQQAIDSRDHYSGLGFDRYRQYLDQAFVLRSSVSTHFRHAALGTHELWQGVPLRLTSRKAIHKASSLLQHCIALATQCQHFHI
jgi:hypothetical protein